MNTDRRFRRSAYKKVLERAQAHEQATADSPTKRALSAALDAIAMPKKRRGQSAAQVVPLDFPRRTPARGSAELQAWCAIGEQYVDMIEALDRAIEVLHQQLAKLSPKGLSRFGIEWRPYKERTSGYERHLLKPVFFEANRRARSFAAGGVRKRRFTVSEIPLESMRASLAHGKFFKTPERTDAAREVLLELRAVLTLREELAEIVNGAITRAGYWKRGGEGKAGGKSTADAALVRVAELAFVLEPLSS
jgi:hypothetical protein